MSLYASLAEVRAEMLAESTIDDTEVINGIRQVSRRIDDMFRIRNLFVPVIRSRRVSISGLNVNSLDGTLSFSYPLLAFTGASIGSNTFVVGTNIQAYPIDSIPYYQLQLIGSSAPSWYNAFCTDVRGLQFVSISGIWGYNADYSEAWLDVDELDGNIDNAQTTLVVTDVAGDDPNGNTPRISAGNILQIDAEWMDVISTDTVTNTATVKRGVNGSTKAAHTDGTTVSVYQVEESIKRAVVRQTAFQYARKGAYESRRIGDLTVTEFPSDVLHEFNALLKLFSNL